MLDEIIILTWEALRGLPLNSFIMENHEYKLSEDRPENVEQEHLEFLDDLRESAIMNMFGASTELENEFGLSRRTAKEVLAYWMRTFGSESR